MHVIINLENLEILRDSSTFESRFHLLNGLIKSGPGLIGVRYGVGVVAIEGCGVWGAVRGGSFGQDFPSVEDNFLGHRSQTSTIAIG